MSAAQCRWCQPICGPSQVQHFTHATSGGGRHAQEKHMTKKRQSSAGCGISSLEQTSLTLRTVTSRAKNWVSSDSQLSSRLIRLQLILRPDTTLLLLLLQCPLPTPPTLFWIGPHSITAARRPHCTLLPRSPEASKFNTYNLQLSVISHPTLYISMLLCQIVSQSFSSYVVIVILLFHYPFFSPTSVLSWPLCKTHFRLFPSTPVYFVDSTVKPSRT